MADENDFSKRIYVSKKIKQTTYQKEVRKQEISDTKRRRLMFQNTEKNCNQIYPPDYQTNVLNRHCRNGIVTLDLFSNYVASLNSRISLHEDHLIFCTLFAINSQKTGRKMNLEGTVVKALLDNGSLAGNFVSQQTFDHLISDSNVHQTVDGPIVPICSGLDGSYYNVPAETYMLKVEFQKEHTSNTSSNDTSSLVAHFRILPKSPFPMILGRETIKEFNLVLAFPSHFLVMVLSKKCWTLPIYYCLCPIQ